MNLNTQEVNDINSGLDLYHQLVEAKMEAERWKAKYEELEQNLAGDEVTRLMAEVLDWRYKYDVLDKAHNMLEARSRQDFAKEHMRQNMVWLYDVVVELIQQPLIADQWEKLLAILKLSDADRFETLKMAIQKTMASRSMNAPE